MMKIQHIENIIIGTLLDYSGDEYWEDVRCNITEDMIKDETNKRIFHVISDMHKKGKTMTTPCDLYTEYGFLVEDIVPRMCELANDYSFLALKTQYNSNQYLAQYIYGVQAKYTEIKFKDYVSRYINLLFDEERKLKYNRTKGSAA